MMDGTAEWHGSSAETVSHAAEDKSYSAELIDTDALWRGTSPERPDKRAESDRTAPEALIYPAEAVASSAADR
jgi:hypothetical protein